MKSKMIIISICIAFFVLGLVFLPGIVYDLPFLSRSISANLNILVVPEDAYQRIRNMRLMERFIK